MHAIYGKMELPSGPKLYELGTAMHIKGKSSVKHSVIASSIYYGPDINVADLNTNDTAHFVDYIWSRKSEISQDEDYAGALVKEYLNLCGESGEKTMRARANRTVDFLLHHIRFTPSMEIQLALLKVLDSFDSSRKLQALEPLLEEELHRPQPGKAPALIEYLIRCYLPCNAVAFKQTTDKTLALFLRMLSGDESQTGKETTSGWRSMVRQYALRQITFDFFEQSPAKAQQSIFLMLVDIITNGQHGEVQSAKSVLSNIPLFAKMLSDQLMSIAKALIGGPSVAEAAKSSSKRARVAV